MKHLITFAILCAVICSFAQPAHARHPAKVKKLAVTGANLVPDTKA